MVEKKKNTTPIFECGTDRCGKRVLPDKGSLLAIISILVILLLHNDIIKVRILRTKNSGSFMGILVVH